MRNLICCTLSPALYLLRRVALCGCTSLRYESHIRQSLDPPQVSSRRLCEVGANAIIALWRKYGESRFTNLVVKAHTLKAETGHPARSDSKEVAMYLLSAAACLAFWCYQKLIVHVDGNYSNALLAVALLATALHLLKTAETA